MASQQLELAPNVNRNAAPVTLGGTAAGNVRVEFDDELTNIQVIATLQNLIKNIQEFY
jgi:hypothetical protein